jgi:hypothetical protein
MYKFKYKAMNEPAVVFHFNTLKEVTEYIYLLCESSNLEDILKVQKEYNIRFYISRINASN